MRPPIQSDNSLISENWRVRLAPILLTLTGSLLSLLPVVTAIPILPPFGFLTLLAWRLLRPEIFPAWAGLPLGLADDLLTGQPIGSGAALWTLTLLLLDYSDRQLIWRDFWIDWALGAVAVLAYLLLGNFMTGIGANLRPVLALFPQLIASILCFPAVMRMVARVDRWRLSRHGT